MSERVENAQPRIAAQTLGCKVSQYESTCIVEAFCKRGYESCAFDAVCDVYVINTCTVTNIADRKSRQMLHRAKKQNPEAIVVAMGCYVQAGEENVLEDECI